MKVFLGIVVGLAIAYFMELKNGSTWLMLDGPYVTIREDCDPASDRCVYVRKETTLGFDYVSVETIRWTRRHAAIPTFSRDGVQCDPEANVSLNWLPDRLQIITNRVGDCFRTGKFVTPFEIEIVN